MPRRRVAHEVFSLAIIKPALGGVSKHYVQSNNSLLRIFVQLKEKFVDISLEERRTKYFT